MSDASLAALLLILHIAEASGLCPSQLEELIVALIDKPDGGDRPIGLYGSSESLVASSKGPFCEVGEEFCEPIFLCQ